MQQQRRTNCINQAKIMSNKSMTGSSCCCCCMLLLLLLVLPAMPNATAATTATRRARISASSSNNRSNNNSHNEPLTESIQAAATSKAAVAAAAGKLKTSTGGSGNNADSKYEIRAVAGEPNYKSVNLTWEVEFVTSAHDTDTKMNANTNTNTNTNTSTNTNAIVNADGVTNMSSIVEPPKAFQIFYCEMQNYGPQRCRVKLVNATVAQQRPQEAGHEEAERRTDDVDSQVQHFAAAVDNLRMATRYSFHVRPVQPRRLRSSSARAEFQSENEIEGAAAHLPGQSIIVPTKGFSAHATQCLAQASEIEVETGPFFGGRIVVDGGDCGIKGNANDPADRYTMRIDHKLCGSMVKPETNTVETFITVQENLGIFTHSTRRFVVVCSYQSGMQTVRASFTVPGKNAGVAAAFEPNDPFQPDEERLGRELRHMRYVNKSELVLKETEPVSESEQESVEQPALVMETQPPEPQPQQGRQQGRALSLASLNEVNNLAELEEEEEEEEAAEAAAPVGSKYAKLVVEQARTSADASQNDDEFYAASLRYVSANLGSVLVTVSISVIIISICLVLLQRQRLPNNNNNHSNSNNTKLHSHLASLPHKTLPRALQQQYQCTL